MNYTVLIVDDEAMPRKVLKDHLPWDTLKVTKIFQASDGQEAIEQARLCHPDIIISDIKMPRMDGIQMAFAIREFCPHCQFIFLSGYSDKEYLKGAIKLKAASYVEKPVDLEEIKQALTDVIDELDKLQKTENPDLLRTLFFHGRTDSDAPLNTAVFEGSQLHLDSIAESIRQRREADTEAALRRLYRKASRCEGTEPDYLRHFYRQIVFLFLTAAEDYNITGITRESDFYLYTAAGRETLSELWDELLTLSRTYFASLAYQDTDIVSRVDRYLEQIGRAHV